MCINEYFKMTFAVLSGIYTFFVFSFPNMQTEGRLWWSVVAPRLKKNLSKDKNTSKRAYNCPFSVLYKTSFGKKESKQKSKSCN